MQSLHARTWLAVKGKAPDAVCAALDLSAGMAVTTRGTFALEGAASDAGWYLITAAGQDHRLIQEPVLTALSAGCEVLTCTVEERNLVSAATGWANGRRLWSVSYDGEERPGEVAAEGDLPGVFAIVAHAVGYRPDEASRAFDGRFVLLQANHPTFMQRLFGG
jgi:hypothetical protein